jgi:O-antigen biosynthesis protein
MADERTIFDEPHHQSLELLAAQALSDGNIATAFRLADRRCRILPIPEPHCYVLRGDASFQMGAKEAAIADIAKALEIAPDNIAANRRLLAWTTRPEERLQAALTLIGHDSNFESLRKAIEVLHQNGERTFAHVTVFADAIEGWAVWGDDSPLTISISDDAATVSKMFEPNEFHPLAAFGHATGFIVKRPKSITPQSILLSVAGIVFHSIRTAGNEAEPLSRVHWPRPKAERHQRVTVIVPVYGDYEATRLCLETLLDELKSSHHRAILVDDATPDPRIAKYVTKLGKHARIDALVNARNRGFIGSVNRALEQIENGDVILLNSDTIVPPGFIDRLTAATRSSPDIGTVTPLSNNGEFTSFPIPNTSNPLCSREEINRIDAIAAQANSDAIVDIPSGIGFCLYLTRPCLNAVGPLSEDFEAGYLEDADFCLRARERGFRNVCAPSVYVGHAGSKSFGQEKRALVVRNLTVLERRYPKHSSECAAFMVADPLLTARIAIERAAAATACHPILLLTSAGAIGTIARQRARDIASESNPIMILEIHYRLDGARVTISNTSGGMPQSLQFNLASSSECDLLVDFIKRIQPSRLEILDPAKTPIYLIELLMRLKIPYDLFIADAGLLGPNSGQFIAVAAASVGVQNIKERRVLPSVVGTVPGDKDWVDHWRRIADGAQRIYAPSPEAEAFAATVLPKRSIDSIGCPAKKHSRAMGKSTKAATPQLGLVPAQCSAREQWLMSEITRRLNKLRPDISITIIGTTLDDLSLMRGRNAFVTGAVDAEEFEREIDSLGLDHLFVITTRPLFGHPILSVAHSSSLAKAYFDWSKGAIKPEQCDLPFDPCCSVDDIVDSLDRWMPTP